MAEINQAYCILPWVHLHIDEENFIKPCCYGQPIKKYTTDFDFETDKDFTQIRQAMLQGQQVEFCSTCYQVDQLGGQSYRQRDTQEWFSRLGVNSPDDVKIALQYYDIRNDSLCNLACRICYPGVSTQLAREHQRIGWFTQPNQCESKLSEIVDFKNVRKVYVAGGEPTVMPEFKRFLERAIEQQRTDIELQIVSNGTNLNSQYCQLLKHFSNVSVTISIDGYDQVNKYIRWSTNWNQLVNNIKNLNKITKNISFNITVSIYNVCRLRELVDFLDTSFEQPIILLNVAVPNRVNHSKINISPFNFANRDQALTAVESLKQTQSYRREEYFCQQVEYFIQGLQTSTCNIEELKKFFEYNDTLDTSRNIKLIDYIPELEACRAYLTKQT